MRPSNASIDSLPEPFTGDVQPSAAPSDAVRSTNGATSPSSSARYDAANVSIGPGDKSYVRPATSSVPTRVAPTAPPSVQRSPTRRSSDALTACFVKRASSVVPCDVSLRRVLANPYDTPARQSRGSPSSPEQ